MIVTTDISKLESERDALEKRISVINKHFDKELAKYDNQMYQIEVNIDDLENKLAVKE